MPTGQEFIENWPLYTRANIQNFSPPPSITRMCSTCGKETTWQQTDHKSANVDVKPSVTFDWVGYTCALCGENCLVAFFVRFDWSEDNVRRLTWSYKAVKKIGQIPPQSIDIPAELSKRLGSAAAYYKNALVCRSQNFGIGAVAYMRRVVEEKTDDLIDVVVELAQTYNADEKTLKSLTDAKTQVRYEDKLRVASEAIPDALKPGGVNPVGQLYTHLSVGLHGKTDDECVAIFDDLQADFEYVFRNLHVQAGERREFAERVQSRAGRKV